MKKLATLAALAGALTMAATAPAQAEMKSAGRLSNVSKVNA